MQIGGHKEKIKLDVVYIEHYSIILRIEQLEKNNLIIDWRTKKIKQEKKVRRPNLKREDVVIGQKTTLRQEIYKLREDSKESDLSYIPKEYANYLDLFRRKEKDNIALLPHRPQDYEINLVEKKEVLFGLIYQMLEEELETL